MTAWTLVKAWLLKELISLAMTVAFIVVLILVAAWIVIKKEKEGKID